MDVVLPTYGAAVKPSPMAYQLQEAIQDTDIILVSAGLTESR